MFSTYKPFSYSPARRATRSVTASANQRLEMTGFPQGGSVLVQNLGNVPICIEFGDATVATNASGDDRGLVVDAGVGFTISPELPNGAVPTHIAFRTTSGTADLQVAWGIGP